MTKLNRKFSVAPMLDWTDKHCRYLMRLISEHAVLYTEMVTTGALLHGDVARHLDFNEEEHPLALQIGGSDPDELAQCVRLAKQWHYDEVNLNCGCPSDRVQSGRFGACLMTEPKLVADCLKAMNDVGDIAVTLKCRIGVDAQDSYEEFRDFVFTATESSGCNVVIVHARKAWLNGLSPKENREKPPLHYDYAYRLKKELPYLEVILNGGITSLEQGLEHNEYVDGIMMGREAYHNLYILSQVDQLFFQSPKSVVGRNTVAEQFCDYAEKQIKQGGRLHYMTRHLLGLYHNEPRSKKFRRSISENVHKNDAGVEVIKEALALLSFN